MSVKRADGLFYEPFAASGSENIVYRAICNDYDKLDVIDKHFVLTTITSTSVMEEKSRAFFGMPDCVGPKLLLKIDISSVKEKGIYVKRYSSFREEEEILLPIGTILRTTADPQMEGDKKIIKCQTIPVQPYLNLWKKQGEGDGGLVGWTKKDDYYMYFPRGVGVAEADWGILYNIWEQLCGMAVHGHVWMLDTLRGAQTKKRHKTKRHKTKRHKTKRRKTKRRKTKRRKTKRRKTRHRNNKRSH
jgi:hypothetical protein